jgi:enterochelin esterase-like enzyme
MTACMRAGGRVEVNEFTTILLPQPLVYRIYLPPCYDEQPERSYPALYLIHGQTYSDTQWDRLGVPETADRLSAAGEIAPFIVVMPRDRVWLEPTKDKFGLAVEQALIPWVDEHYRTIPERGSRAIGGLSRGGAWAIHLGLSHPELFSVVGLHSGFVFHSDVQPLYLWLYNLPEGLTPRIYMDIADDDRPEISESATWLENMLTQYDIPHEWHMFVGEHEEEYWQAHVEDYLRWYSMDWGN